MLLKEADSLDAAIELLRREVKKPSNRQAHRVLRLAGGLDKAVELLRTVYSWQNWEPATYVGDAAYDDYGFRPDPD